MSKGTITVKLLRSPVGTPGKTKAWVAGLGLKRPNRSVTLPDTPAVRGMLAKVPHMVAWTAEASKTGHKKATTRRTTTRESAGKSR